MLAIKYVWVQNNLGMELISLSFSRHYNTNYSFILIHNNFALVLFYILLLVFIICNNLLLHTILLYITKYYIIPLKTSIYYRTIY